jgi:uncharacterized protein YjbJ (UPF0337 family)
MAKDPGRFGPENRRVRAAGAMEDAMNWDVIKGKWRELKGEARQQWGRLTDDDWQQVAGEKDKLVGKLQQRYGWSKEEAEKNADDYFGSLS